MSKRTTDEQTSVGGSLREPPTLKVSVLRVGSLGKPEHSPIAGRVRGQPGTNREILYAFDYTWLSRRSNDACVRLHGLRRGAGEKGGGPSGEQNCVGLGDTDPREGVSGGSMLQTDPLELSLDEHAATTAPTTAPATIAATRCCLGTCQSVSETSPPSGCWECLVFATVSASRPKRNLQRKPLTPQFTTTCRIANG